MLTGMQLGNIAQQATQRAEKLTTLQGRPHDLHDCICTDGLLPSLSTLSYTCETFCDSRACLMLYNHLMILAFLSMAEMP